MRFLPLLLVATLLIGCPPKEDKAAQAQLQPSAPLPADGPLLRYENLRLGMTNLDLAQLYNAPEGKGKGFTRQVEEFGDVRNHLIDFDKAAGAPTRRIVLRIYQDKLAVIVDRRDGLTRKQAEEWMQSLLKVYGKPANETLPGAQWVWGEKGALTLTFTQDNNSDINMSANVVLRHEPTYEASKRYLQYREQQK